MSLIIREVLASARRRLRSADFEPSTREAALLLGHLLGWTESQVLAREDQPLSAADHRRFEQALDRRLAGEPVAYILGRKEFYGRDFVVDSRVLIPRPETEHLVDMVLDLPLPGSPRLLDVGTGSGCLACTLALELPASRVVASDVSTAALAVAARNRRHHDLLDRLHLVAADLAEGIRLAKFDLVVSNPPYIASPQADSLSREIIDFEPAGALFAGPEGSEVHRRLLTGMIGLPRGAWMMLEIDSRQGELFRHLGAETPFRLVELRDDYAGLPRVALLQRR